MLFPPVPNLLDGLTLQADLCLERGDRPGAALFIDLIYELHDGAEGEGDTADHIDDTRRELLAVGAN